MPLFKKLELNRLMSRIAVPAKNAIQKEEFLRYEKKPIKDPGEISAFVDSLKRRDAVFLALPQNLMLLAVCDHENVYCLSAKDFSAEEWRDFLRVLFSKEIKKVIHNAKPLMAKLLEEGMALEGLAFDTALGAYIVNPAENDYSIEKCAQSYLSYSLCSEKEFEAADSFSLFLEDGRIQDAICDHACAVSALFDVLRPRIADEGVEKLYYDIELPLIEVLADMQHIGFKIDKASLISFGEGIDKRVAVLKEDIYCLAGEPFNINSSQQLGKILFEKLSLPHIKKTRTGYSTDIEVLEKLSDKHEIIKPLIEYRQLVKLKSTYVDGLSKVISPEDDRIHSSFNQMATATGRLSSTEPNLQNIPIRQELGSEIRGMFVPGDRESVLIDADYSQIELRILAHMADDANMKMAFSQKLDIHTFTAASVFHVKEDEVTPAMRRAAKAVNFGIVYGISDFSLSEDIGVSRAKAREYIDNYLEHYSGVRDYMTRVKEEAKANGYVKTLLGRRRYLPELLSSNFNIRSFGERVALNAPIQGTAADIMKIAMVSVYRRLKEEKLKTRLVLQVHDELVLEAPKEEAEYAAKLLREEMEGAYPLSVEISCDVSYGDNWFAAKK